MDFNETLVDEIRFYHPDNPHGWLSNFSPHGFHLDGHDWPTVEHYFQAQKFEDPVRQEEGRLPAPHVFFFFF